jgi:hypothetical protein
VHVDSLAKEVLKHKKEWLDKVDVFSIFYDLVYDAIMSVVKGEEQLSGNLWNLLGEEKASQLVANIKEYLIGIPSDFDIYIFLPAISKKMPAVIKLSDSISLVSFENSNDVPGGYYGGLKSFLNKFEINKAYIKQSVKGYVGRRIENAYLKRAVNNMKIIFQHGLFRELLKRTPEDKAGLGLLNAFASPQRKSSIISVDHNRDVPVVRTIDLPNDISRFVGNVDINWENDLITTAVEAGRLAEAMHRSFARSVQLIECSEVESDRVKSAIKWCFDSYITENETLSFLQICIGLEALLGDDEYKGALTELLADRYAYLVSDDIKGRKTIKDNFKKLYDVRSRLVHGNALELDSDQRSFLHWGQKILEYSIMKEIKHLRLGESSTGTV